MKRTLPMIVATATALGACHAFAHDREVILNYSDLHGVDLALALVH